MVTFSFSNIVQDIGNILLPLSCFGCNARLFRGEVTICTACRHQLPLTNHTFNEENSVDRIFYGRINIKKTVSFLFMSNTGIVKNIIHHLKYRNQETIGAFLGDWFGQILLEQNSLPPIDFVVAVPLHKKKLKKRGYNQVSLFAKRVAYHLNSTYSEQFIEKTANTKTQTKKNRLSRWYDNASLYQVKNAHLLEGKRILLIDDVITTGATIEICAKSFAEVKGIEIYVASIAVAR